MAVHAMTATEVADHLGLQHEAVRSMMRRGRFAPADVVIGGKAGRAIRGWTMETVDAWNATRRK